MLITIARDSFRDFGYRGTNLSRVAAQASLTKGALYHHFADKRALLDAVVQEIQAELRDAVASAARQEKDYLDRLIAGSLAYLDACVRLEALSTLLFVEAPAGLGWRRWRQIDAKYFRRDLEALVEIVIATRGLELSAAALTSAVSAVLMDAALEITSSDVPEQARQEAETTLRTLLKSLT